jgi:hypothetical protein
LSDPRSGAAITQAVTSGFRDAFVCEHDGSDAITVISGNRASIQDLLAQAHHHFPDPDSNL